MSSVTFLFILVNVLTLLFLALNFLLAPSEAYPEKYSIFECGFHSFLGQNRLGFDVGFLLMAIMFLVVDLELVAMYPLATSLAENEPYGIIVGLLFTLIVTLGFIYEIGKGALHIYTRQDDSATYDKDSDKKYTQILSSKENFPGK